MLLKLLVLAVKRAAVGGNIVKIWVGYQFPSTAYITPSSNQWDLTYDYNSNPLTGTPNFTTAFQKSSAHSMPSDTILDADDVPDILDDVGCRLPLNTPVLDNYDTDLVDN